MNYQEAGVDVKKGDQFVHQIGSFIKSTYNENVKAGVGGFAALYELGEQYLVAGTDGVGTKLLLARELHNHSTIGQDLVAMCVNDIICTGATPLFFLDYLATGKLVPSIHEEVVKSIAGACKESSCALIGGETAEMPGCYDGTDYDLAGFAVGQVSKNDLIDGSLIKPGMTLMGIPSSGFHSNGYSLLRQIIKDQSPIVKNYCLTPTRIYQKEVQSLLRTKAVYGLAHITGGGLNNIKRMNESFNYCIDALPKPDQIMQDILDWSGLSYGELYTSFNMGVGFTLVTDSPQKILTLIPDSFVLGSVREGSGVTCMGIDI